MTLISASAAAAPDDFAPPPAEIAATDVKLALPAVPSFEVPSAALEDTHSVKELRVAGTQLRDTSVTVHGYITWVYDCATAERKLRESDRAVRKRIDEDPTLCERPKFYVGDTAATAPEQSLWVVDVPRAYNKLEVSHIQKAERTMPDRCEPGDKKQKVCPPYQVGDVVTITGDFKTRSPHSETNSDGLLVYHAMTNETRKWESAGWSFVAKPAAQHAQTSARAPRPQLPAIAQSQATRDPQSRRDFDAGIEHALHAEWGDAVDAFGKSVARRPDVAMYQMWLGIALYEQTHRDASAAVSDKPLVHLLLALELEPKLWRARYYLARIDRDATAWKAAAEDFTLAIQANPHMAGLYIGLAEIYRRYDYTDQAIEVATQATQNTRDPDAWFELGVSYADKHMDAKAVEALTKAIDARNDNARALFARGQAYFRMRDFSHAKRDLEAVVSLGAPSDQRTVATLLLSQIK